MTVQHSLSTKKKMPLFSTSQVSTDREISVIGNIYVSKMDEDGQFGPGVLVSELSSPFRDTRTAIRRDGLEIFITSARPGRVGPVPTLCCNLWVSTRKDPEDPWPLPVNLGPVFNSPANDGAPALSRDGTTLYFNSTRPGGSGANDLYVTTRTRLYP